MVMVLWLNEHIFALSDRFPFVFVQTDKPPTSDGVRGFLFTAGMLLDGGEVVRPLLQKR